MVRGRRTRVTPVGAKKTKKMDSALESITQRTRNLRKSLHKIQKQFDNQAITKFFQRTVKQAGPRNDNDENACDAYAAEQLDDLGENNNGPEMSDHTDAGQTSGDQIGDQSNHSIQQTNIFLQKPVLHLNIDKSPNQASSIVINKHLEVCANFAAAFPVFNSSASNTAKKHCRNKSSEDESSAEQNEVQSGDAPKTADKPRPRKRKPRKCATGWSNTVDANDSDNSCDSGVVSDRSFELSSTDGNKPTTPHRIVCPTTSTSEQKPKIDQKPSSRGKGVAVKRGRGKQTQKNAQINNAKSYFTKLAAVSDAQAKGDDATKSDDSCKTEDSKSDVDCEMSSLNIESTNSDSQIVKSILPKPLSRSSTPLQFKLVQSKQMTDYFPVRRSIRKTKKEVEKEYLRDIEKAIEQQCEDGLAVKLFKDKGRGICAGRPFARGEFVVEYIGDLIEQSEADRREEIYAKDSAFGCYMYYFKHKEQQWCIDATAETGKLGRLVNHSRNGNLVTKIVTYKNRPHLVLIAKEDIKEGEEFTYDYGDRTRESLVNHPWLAL